MVIGSQNLSVQNPKFEARNPKQKTNFKYNSRKDVLRWTQDGEHSRTTKDAKFGENNKIFLFAGLAQPKADPSQPEADPSSGGLWRSLGAIIFKFRNANLKSKISNPKSKILQPF